MKHLLERGGLSGREFYSAKWRPQMGAHLLQGFHRLKTGNVTSEIYVGYGLHLEAVG